MFPACWLSAFMARQGSKLPWHSQVAWLTPSELFTPYYGAAVASFLLAEHARTRATGAPLRIIEVHKTWKTFCCGCMSLKIASSVALAAWSAHR